MKILVTGANGQLGYDLCVELIKRKMSLLATDLAEVTDNLLATSFYQLDITNEDAVNRLICDQKPDAIIHCAGWTAVDAAEEICNKEKVYRVNVIGTKNLANACKIYNCRLMYISTDYVFDGNGDTTWLPECNQYAPLNFYGQTKLDGEKVVADTLEQYYIVRIAWAFGVHGNNFVKTMLSLSETHGELKVVNDQIGTPTYTKDLARLLVDMIQTGKYGYYHATNEGGYISWYDFACEIFKQAKRDVKVIPVSTSEYGISKAKRPFNSRLDKTKLVEQGFKPLPDWEDALRRYLIELDEGK